MKPFFRRAIVTAALIAGCPVILAAVPQLGLSLIPQALIPLGNAPSQGTGLEPYSVGYGAELHLDLSVAGFLSPYFDGAAGSIPLNNTGTSIGFAQTGLGLSLYSFPLSRLTLRLGASGGLTWLNIPKTSLSDAVSGLAPYWKSRAEMGYRFGPSFDVSAGLGYQQILGSQAPIYKGLSAGAVVRLGLDGLFGAASGLSAKVESERSVFPIIWYKGKGDPILKVRIYNQEAAEIRDVKVTFSAGEYTSRTADCGSFRILARGASAEVPIYADFSDKVLAFSETTKVQGLVRVDYRVLDARRSFTHAVTIVFNNRNAATWADDRVVGAFVSPQDPAMLDLSKYVAGLVRVSARPEIDKYLQYGMGLFEALRVYGVTFSPDPVLPYAAARKDVSKTGYIQYPWQTLSYKSGDSDALALLFAEALESVAVPTAIAALPGDCIVAFPLDMDEARVRTSFETISNFIFADGKAWVPIRASMIREGFLPAWKAGAELWNASLGKGESPRLVPLIEAWKEFQPIAVPDVAFSPIKPSESAVTAAFESTLERFVDAEVGPKVKRLTSAFEGKGTARQHNSLGIVYAQYGMYPEARAEFEKASALGSVPAIVNLANVAFLMKDYESAAAWFQKALVVDPNNKAALIGLARARYELDAYADADSLFARVKAIDPALAERYAYLSSKIDGNSALRASSSAADRGGGMLWDGGE